MGNLRSTKRTANQYWTDILFQIRPNNNVIPLAGPTFLWDSRITSTLSLVGNSVDVWADYYQNAPLSLFFGEDLSKAPTYLSGVSPTISFNGINNYLAINPGLADLEFTLMIVTSNLQPNLASNSGNIIWLDTNDAFFEMQYITENQIGLSLADTQLGVFVNQPIQVMIIQFLAGGTAANIWQNGGEQFPASGFALTSGIQFLQIGAFLGNNYLQGNIPWLAYYNSAISLDEINTALDYLAVNFNIPVTPAIIT